MLLARVSAFFLTSKIMLFLILIYGMTNISGSIKGLDNDGILGDNLEAKME